MAGIGEDPKGLLLFPVDGVRTVDGQSVLLAARLGNQAL